MAKVKNFWIKPENLPVTIKEFSFGYEDEKGKQRHYKASIKGGDLRSFHSFIFAIKLCKAKSLLPWAIPQVREVKNKVSIINPTDDSEQTEMVLRVASSFQQGVLPWELP
jgi:hypothetical protein